MVGELIGDVPMLRGDAELSELVDQLEIDRVIFTSEARETRDDGNDTLCELADRDIQIDLIPRLV